jgi:hypothetical protein
MNRLFRTTVVEISGVRTISGGGTNASNPGQALLNLFGVSLTGNQTISGVKTFASRPTVNGTGVLLSGEAVESNGTINKMIKLTQSQYNALSPVDPTTFYVIVG